MTVTHQSPTTTTRPRNLPLIAARVVAGVLGVSGVMGAGYFMFVVPEEAVWLGPAVDVPVLTLLFGGILLKVVTGFAPGLSDHRRIQVGLAAVGLYTAATLLKIPLYDEPEGVTFLAADAVLLAFLLLARGRTSGPSRAGRR